ncbi:DNA primase [uncultured Limosilactobacillus sp.]|uniref:DNA primase n=1 Tax=uncultured Limosilactobacillus sp. TaxID=2837629 RepID=UPI0025F589AC|nr:DNA primase [uncultured Limosilactobacillus sp.]
MARIPNELIDQIRDSVNIVDVISQDVQLKKQGKNLMGHCPFHRDDTPSFAVNEQKQFFYCFSCHRSGNVFGFLQQLHNLSFPDAVQKVAEMSNIAIPRQYTNEQQRAVDNSPKGQLIKLHDQTAKLYHHLLVNTEAGEKALHYLIKRGVSREMIDQFDLGYAVEQNQEEVLREYVQAQKLDYQLLRQSGLFIEDQQGQLHDRFHGRIMYPIKNENGHVIAFSGRILAPKAIGNEPKYMNSPETPIFNKRRTLFNLNLAKQAARQTGSLTLFEGFMDVIAAYSVGVKNGVASMGTNLTEEQIRTIQRISGQVNICYDGDDPGQNAINRAIRLFKSQAPHLKIKIIQLPAGIDPDEYVQKYGGIKFSEYLNQKTETPVEFRLRFLQMGLNLKNQDELMGYLNAALQVIGGVDEPVARDIYLQRLATQFDLDKSSLVKQLTKIQPSVKRHSPTAAQRPPQGSDEQAIPVQTAMRPLLSKLQSAEQRLLKYYIVDEAVRKRLHGQPDFAFADSKYQQLYQQIQDYFIEHEEFSTAAMLDRVDSSAQRQILTQIAELAVDENISDDAVNDCIRVIMNEAPLDQQIVAKKAALNEATMMNDQELTTKLATELVTLYQRQQQMKTEELN